MPFPIFFAELMQNRILWSAVTAWFVAQLAKTIIYGILNKDWKLERMVGSGGMPSSHAATVCALVISVLYNYGPNSFPFTISVLFAIVVLHDARGVRFETGKQAEAIMDLYAIVDALTDVDLPQPEKLKVLVGHTPLQVAAGSLIGIVTGILLH